ncbi:MAG: exonuclease RecJ [Salinigranum sp.]
MSTARSSPADVRPDDLADALGEAPFVRVLARTDGDALAAAGLLARACRQAGIPFQVRASPRLAAPDAEDDCLTLTVGGEGGDFALRCDAESAAPAAYEVARRFDDDADPVLALAGLLASGTSLDGEEGRRLLAAADSAGPLSRRPGVAVPTADAADGLAHTTLAHAPFSGDRDAADAALADLDLPAEADEETHRAVASLFAIEVVAAEGATPRAAACVERALRPYVAPDAPFETVGGYADVLEAAARERPGTAVALALGYDAHAAALDAWRTHAEAVHAALREATSGRYDGVFVARVDLAETGRAATAARLVRDFRSPEPVALVVGDGVAAAASVDPRGLGDVMAEAVARAASPSVDGTERGEDAADAGTDDAADAGTDDAVGDGDERRAEATFDGDAAAFVTAFREVLGR